MTKKTHDGKEVKRNVAPKKPKDSSKKEYQSLAELEHLYGSATERIKVLEAELNGATAELHLKDTEISSLQGSINALGGKIRSLESIIGSLNEQLTLPLSQIIHNRADEMLPDDPDDPRQFKKVNKVIKYIKQECVNGYGKLAIRHSTALRTVKDKVPTWRRAKWIQEELIDRVLKDTGIDKVLDYAWDDWTFSDNRKFYEQLIMEPDKVRHYQGKEYWDCLMLYPFDYKALAAALDCSQSKARRVVKQAQEKELIGGLERLGERGKRINVLGKIRCSYVWEGEGAKRKVVGVRTRYIPYGTKANCYKLLGGK